MRRNLIAVLAGISILGSAASHAAEGGAASMTARDKYERGYRMIVHAKSEGEIAEAVALIESAAADRFVPAYTLMGTILSQGAFLRRDPKQAERLLKEAAQAGDATAMNNLAVLYAEGDGIPADLTLAREWADKAAQKGIVTASNLVVKIEARQPGRQAAKGKPSIRETESTAQAAPAKGLTPPTPTPAPAQEEVEPAAMPPPDPAPPAALAVRQRDNPYASLPSKLARIVPSLAPGRRSGSKSGGQGVVPAKEGEKPSPVSAPSEPAVAALAPATDEPVRAKSETPRKASPSRPVAVVRDAAPQPVLGGIGPMNRLPGGGTQPYYVQLASIAVDADPEKEWSRLNRLSRGALVGEQPVFQVIDVVHKNAAFIRILLGPHLSKAEAEASCRRLTALGVRACLVKRD